jgi:2OG-Fe(II) oxygenase superfamily
MCISMNPVLGSSPVLTVDLQEALTVDAMEALASGKHLAIVVPGFTPRQSCEVISERLIQDHRLGGYTTSDGAASIKKIGMPLFEAAGRDPEKIERYYATARQMIAALRQLSRPAAYPMDELRLALQEQWPAGADFEMLHPGRKMFVGMPRVFETNSGALPHIDRLAWDVPEIPSARTMVAQIAANVHLRTASEGGQVELWRAALDLRDYDRLRLADSYGLDRNRLPSPDAVVMPKVGDLILFNSNRIHAVNRCTGGPRVTVSCFIGYRGASKPLTYWS